MSTSTFFRPNVKALLKDNRASVAIYFALVVTVISALIGLGIDLNRAMNLRTTLNAAADAAALATARDIDVNSNNLQERAEAFFMANMQGQSIGTEYAVTAKLLPDNDGVHLDATAQMDTIMSGLIGIDQFTVRAQSEAVYSTTKIELAMVLDNTGSMGWSGKIQTLRSAASDMIKMLMPDGPSTGDVKIGIVPFDIGVNVGTNNAGASWLFTPNGSKKKKKKTWKGCVGPRSDNNDVNDSSATGANKIPPIYGDQTSCNLPAIMPLSENRAALLAKAESMQAAGWTYIPEGLAWGWKVLSPKLPFSEGIAYSDPDWQKVLVLMTDGANTVKWTWSSGQPSAQKGVSSSFGDSKTKVLCNSIKNSDIIIYTVAFQVSSSNTRKMLEGCASNSSNYFDAKNNAELVAAFAKIGGDINNLRLSK